MFYKHYLMSKKSTVWFVFYFCLIYFFAEKKSIFYRFSNFTANPPPGAKCKFIFSDERTSRVSFT